MDNYNTVPNTKKNNKALIILISVIAVIVISVACYFIFLYKPATPSDGSGNNQPEETTPIDAEPVASADKPEEERLSDYTKEIELAGNDEDRLSLILDNVMVLMEYGRSGEALTSLQSIDVSNLSDFDLYRVYSHFAYVYDTIEDYNSADKYHALANDAYDRYEAAGGQ